MPRVPVAIIGETIRAGWGLKVGTRIKVGQPFRLDALPRRVTRRRR
jgi:hypothetical protein